MNKRKIKKMYDYFSRNKTVAKPWRGLLTTGTYLNRINRIRGIKEHIGLRSTMRIYVKGYGKVFHTDLITAGRWFELPEARKVRRTHFDTAYVSTVFLCFEHGHENNKPILWETMIFGGDHDDYTLRASTEEQALENHKVACNLVEHAINTP